MRGYRCGFSVCLWMPVSSEESEIKNTRRASLRTLERDKVVGKFFRKEEKASAALLELNCFAFTGEISIWKVVFQPCPLYLKYWTSVEIKPLSRSRQAMKVKQDYRPWVKGHPMDLNLGRPPANKHISSWWKKSMGRGTGTKAHVLLKGITTARWEQTLKPWLGNPLRHCKTGRCQKWGNNIKHSHDDRSHFLIAY